MKRYGWVIRVKPEKFEEYKKIHANVWPEVSESIKKHNIRNYSIYHKDGFLFGYWEYIGENLEDDMKAMSKSPKYKEWLSVCDPMQEPLETREKGEWWARMDEVFHQD